MRLRRTRANPFWIFTHKTQISSEQSNLFNAGLSKWRAFSIFPNYTYRRVDWTDQNAPVSMSSFVLCVLEEIINDLSLQRYRVNVSEFLRSASQLVRISLILNQKHNFEWNEPKFPDTRTVVYARILTRQRSGLFSSFKIYHFVNIYDIHMWEIRLY